jgi:hypothetical protein
MPGYGDATGPQRTLVGGLLEREVVPMVGLLAQVPQIDGGVVAAIVGILNGALNAIFPLLPGLLGGLLPGVPGLPV